MSSFQMRLDEDLAQHRKGSIFLFPPIGGYFITVADMEVFVSRMQESSEMDDDPISINLVNNRFENGAFELMEEFVAQNARKVQSLWAHAPEPNRREDATNMVHCLAQKSNGGLESLYLSVCNESNTQPILEACENGSIKHLDIRCETSLETQQVRLLCEQIVVAQSLNSRRQRPLKSLTVSHGTRFNDDAMGLFVDLFLSGGGLEDAALENYGGLTAASLPRLTQLLKGISAVSNKLKLVLWRSPSLFAEAAPGVIEEFIMSLQDCSSLSCLDLDSVGIDSDTLVRLLRAAEKLKQRPPLSPCSIYINEDAVFTKKVFVQLAKSLPHISGVDALVLSKDDDFDEGGTVLQVIEDNLMTIAKALRKNTITKYLQLDVRTTLFDDVMNDGHPSADRLISDILRRNKYLDLVTKVQATNVGMIEGRTAATEQEEFPIGLWANVMAKVSEGGRDSPSVLRADPIFMMLLQHRELFAS